MEQQIMDEELHRLLDRVRHVLGEPSEEKVSALLGLVVNTMLKNGMKREELHGLVDAYVDSATLPRSVEH